MSSRPMTTLVINFFGTLAVPCANYYLTYRLGNCSHLCFPCITVSSNSYVDSCPFQRLPYLAEMLNPETLLKCVTFQ